MTSDGKLHSLEVMRGIAAIAVALYHTDLILGQPEYGALKLDVFAAFASRGWMGVNFFFVLSGFIIVFAHFKDLGRPDQLPRYAWKRFSRIYPVYWFFLTIYIAAAAAGLGHPNFAWTAQNLLSAYLLVPLTAPLTLPLQIAWTLFYEVAFYALFSIAILNRTAGYAGLLIWMAAILLINVFLTTAPMGPLHMWNIYFGFGIAAFAMFRSLPVRLGTPVLLFGIASLIVACIWAYTRIGDAQQRPLTLLILAIPFALIVLGGSLRDSAIRRQANSFLLLLGQASYSIYLVHAPAISLLAMLNHKFSYGLIPAWLLFPFVATMSVVAGIAAHFVVERPVLACFKRRPVLKDR